MEFQSGKSQYQSFYELDYKTQLLVTPEQYYKYCEYESLRTYYNL